MIQLQRGLEILIQITEKQIVKFERQSQQLSKSGLNKNNDICRKKLMELPDLYEFIILFLQFYDQKIIGFCNFR